MKKFQYQIIDCYIKSRLRKEVSQKRSHPGNLRKTIQAMLQIHQSQNKMAPKVRLTEPLGVCFG